MRWRCQNFSTEEGLKISEIRTLECIYYGRQENKLIKFLRKHKEDSCLRCTKECISEEGDSNIKNFSGGCHL